MDQSSAGRNKPRAQTLMDKAYVDTVRLMLDVAPDVSTLSGTERFGSAGHEIIDCVNGTAFFP
jgi:hypothetical protein